ncbi:basic salivary proline-rich protein 1-like [Eptesicus fuscus]|uniref:basic salivary proline-rich protein 1-like n=1 Tax=Eptesicus fuscus TaxID=29078 RepID=UPI0024040AA8|nr:basic salivary proline-rich protein 1-like [Eptesicus fuscus]
MAHSRTGGRARSGHAGRQGVLSGRARPCGRRGAGERSQAARELFPPAPPAAPTPSRSRLCAQGRAFPAVTGSPSGCAARAGSRCRPARGWAGRGGLERGRRGREASGAGRPLRPERRREEGARGPPPSCPRAAGGGRPGPHGFPGLGAAKPQRQAQGPRVSGARTSGCRVLEEAKGSGRARRRRLPGEGRRRDAQRRRWETREEPAEPVTSPTEPPPRPPGHPRRHFRRPLERHLLGSEEEQESIAAALASPPVAPAGLGS